MADTKWSARVEWPARPTDEQLAILADQLQSPLTVDADAGTVAAQLTIDAGSLLQANDHAIKAVRPAARIAGLAFRPLAVEVVEHDHAIARAARPRIPALAGRAECAAILGVSTARAGQLASDDPDHPGAVQVLAAGPVYVRQHIESYAGRRHKQSGPRPRA